MRAALIALALLAAATLGEKPRFDVVVNARCQATSISRSQLSRLFLKKTSSWECGEQVLPVDQPEESEVRAEFNRSVHQRSTKALKAWWEEQIFSGRDVPPPEKAGDDAVLEFVAGHDSAIGYVSSGARHAGIRVVEVRE